MKTITEEQMMETADRLGKVSFRRQICIQRFDETVDGHWKTVSVLSASATASQVTEELADLQNDSPIRLRAVMQDVRQVTIKMID